MVVGALLGRFVCGWLCPFGLVQDLVYKIPFVRKINRFPGDKLLRYLKYVILAIFVILLPLFVVDIDPLCRIRHNGSYTEKIVIPKF